MRTHDSDTIDIMLQRADVALYQAKSQGRGRTLSSSDAYPKTGLPIIDKHVSTLH
jgi:predicted signal transduction protein with EAL and GGDEF domain